MEQMNQWSPFFPPRTNAESPARGPVWEMWKKFSDAVAQFKENGSRTMVVQHPSGMIEMWNRGKGKALPTRHVQYSLTPSMRANIQDLKLPLGKLHVLDGELIHSKTRDVKDVLYLFDVLVLDGTYLLGKDYGERYATLLKIVGERYLPLDFNLKEGTIYMAQNLSRDKWDWAWQLAQGVDHCEGLVLKRSGAVSRLAPGGSEYNNESFMCRVRKPHKNYRF